MADKFVNSTEWKHMPAGVTRDGFIASMKALNNRGKEFKRSKNI